MEIKRALLLIFILCSFLGATTKAHAIEPPTLISPPDTATVTATTLNWQVSTANLYSGTPYRVQIDDENAFSSPILRDYYKSSTTYNPVLNPGSYYWRVKVRDSSGSWSDWSSIGSFTLTIATPTPLPSPTLTSTPTASPTMIPPSTPTVLPTSSPTPTSTVTPSSTSSPTPTITKVTVVPSPTPKIPTFIVSNIPSSVNSSKSFSVDISITGLSPGNKYYIKGAFFKEGSSNYFGETKVGAVWIKNSKSYSSQHLLTTDSLGSWDGQLEVMADEEDSGFNGSGNYMFKVRRYNFDGQDAVWSNEGQIYIEANIPNEATEVSDGLNFLSNDNDENSSAPENLSPTSASVKPTNNVPSSGKQKLASVFKMEIPKSLLPRSSSVAGIASESSQSNNINPKVAQLLAFQDEKINIPLILGGVFLVTGAFYLVYIKRKG